MHILGLVVFFASWLLPTLEWKAIGCLFGICLLLIGDSIDNKNAWKALSDVLDALKVGRR